ncbi:MAG: hypothetical protein WAK10_02275 [Methanoregula sp.]
MEIKKYLMYLIIATCLLVLIPPIQAVADENSARVIYQTSFTSDPRWDTNNPSTNYWDPNTGMYHFSLEPNTGGYAYTVIDYDRGSFSLDYDMILNRIDDGATFRFGMAGSEMDPSKAPNVLTMFTNNEAKYGQIMVLHLVTPGSKLIEVSSQTSSDPRAYNGPTAKYEINTTYHVAVNYDDNHKTLSMNVNEKKTGREIWSYYINTAENLNGMKRLYLGSKGDYSRMGIYAQGYIDNIQLTAPAVVTPTTSVVTPAVSVTTIPTTKPTLQQTTVVLTPYPTDTPESPSAGILAIAALVITGVCGILIRKKRN